MGGNYPDDYRPWLPGGPECPEALEVRECGECINWDECPCGCGWGFCREFGETLQPDPEDECGLFEQRVF